MEPDPVKTLQYEPPQDDEDMVLAFWNREKELKRAAMMLRSATARASRKVWAAHGETRSGKSHLVHRALKDRAVADLGLCVITVQANNAGSARGALVRVFRTLHERVKRLGANALAGITAEEVDGRRAWFARVEEVIQRFAELQHGVSDGQQTSAMLGFNVGEPKVMGASGEARAQRDHRDERREVLRPLTDEQLVGEIRGALELLVRANHKRAVILFVDDIDLLESDGTEGGRQSDLLLQLLAPLAEVEGVVPVVTTRHLFYAGHQKDLFDFLHVPALPPEGLIEIYRLRVRVFHGGVELFTDEALRFLARHTNGRPGMMLRYLWEVYFDDVGAALPRGTDAVNAWLRSQVGGWLQTEGARPLLHQIIQAVRAGQLQVKPKIDPRSVGLLHRLLHRVPGSQDEYTISGLYREILRETSAFE